MIRIDLKEQRVSAGDRLSGLVTYQTDKPIEIQEAEINLRWYTEGRGDADRQIVQSQKLEIQQLISNVPVAFHFQLPNDGPITYNGPLMRIVWELEVVLKKPGLLCSKEKAHRGFLVLPQSAISA